MNSAEFTIGNNRIQIAIDFAMPAVNEKYKIRFHVTSLDLKDVKRFKMGVPYFLMTNK
ncbi:MAG: hypothetical protein HZA84_02660 [Thaumarchaeota archaeon]|nr:hypothetical protein [Nitrososphaerota archaeon]